MKDFKRNDLSFSLCGLNCKLCPMHIGGYCPGCGGGVGNQACAIARCSLQHKHIEYCFLCPEFPCQKYDAIEQYDSFITHQHQLRDVALAQRLGIDAYNQIQQRKAEILHTLLSQYNDGRRKTFYCLAVNLLPLTDLEQVMAERDVPAASDGIGIATKDKIERLCSELRLIAQRQGIILKLQKKLEITARE